MNLSSIKILFRAPDTMALYGVPYEMRPGQQPGDLWRAQRTEGWIYLGSPGWWGNISRQDQAKIAAFLAQHKDQIPGGPYEWDRIENHGMKENEMATRRRQSAPKGRNADRLFVGVYPTGIVYADKSREAHGDYARCAFLDFATLTLQFERDCPSDLRAEITRDAAKIQARRGEQFAIDASGHTVTLGGGRRTSENMNMANKPRKPIADMISELRSWLPNYDHGPTDYPTLVWRLLASAPGGDEAEDMGYETFNIGWHEIDQLGRMLEAIQDKQDVEDLVAGLMSEEDPEDLEEARRRPRRGARPAARRPVRRGR